MNEVDLYAWWVEMCTIIIIKKANLIMTKAITFESSLYSFG